MAWPADYHGGFDFGVVLNPVNMVAEPGGLPGTATVNAEVDVVPVEVGGSTSSDGQGAVPVGLPLVLGPRMDGVDVPVGEGRREPLRAKRRIDGSQSRWPYTPITS